MALKKAFCKTAGNIPPLEASCNTRRIIAINLPGFPIVINNNIIKNIYVREPKIEIKINCPIFATSNPIPYKTTQSKIKAAPTAGTNPKENLLNHQDNPVVGFTAEPDSGNIKLKAKAPMYSPSEINIGANA